MLNKDFPETYTQAYQAGVICAMAHNTFLKEDLPTFITCAINFYALREVFGERMWQKMKSRSAFRARVALYESMNYQPGMPRILIGKPEDFALGYCRSYGKSKAKYILDEQRLEAINTNTVGIQDPQSYL